ncbi:MAG: aminotransferase class V-fold PLP-dependent enzyme [Planctomycetia bacterium]|nr:aminotransferase class V-fold PLP-dependent enzyme [Planctomycetia bacterium]
MSNPWRELWSLQPGVTYLNHGSFGPPPKSVEAARGQWIARLDGNPMDFFVRQMEGHLEQARHCLGGVFGTSGDNLLFVDNATFAMNIVAAGFPLEAGDEVLATNHEYGAVLRIWRGRCKDRGARFVVQKLPESFRSADEVVDSLFAGVTERTRLIVVSHITSPTALILPVAEICRRARSQGIRVCIDGPHALAAVPVNLDGLDCDFYCASCHKWLSAPFGAGFLYVHPRWKQTVRPVVVSWGDSLSGRPHSWQDEFVWSGTRDPSPFLATTAAIEFFSRANQGPGSECGLTGVAIPESVHEGDWSRHDCEKPVGINVFRAVSRDLVATARHAILAVTQLEPIGTPEWYRTMITMPLPDSVSEIPHGHMHPLQAALWEQNQIEVPIVSWNGRRHIRVSCHLYNDETELQYLTSALRALLATAARV